jgi:hypothetical protein
MGLKWRVAPWARQFSSGYTRCSLRAPGPSGDDLYDCGKHRLPGRDSPQRAVTYRSVPEGGVFSIGEYIYVKIGENRARCLNKDFPASVPDCTLVMPEAWPTGLFALQLRVLKETR